MNNIKISKITSPLKGQINPGGSKSISNRLLIIDAIGSLNIDFENLSPASDTITLKTILTEKSEILNCGTAGTTLRFLTALMALYNKSCTITGDERMFERPIGPLVEALIVLGAHIEYELKEGFPPIRILKNIGMKGSKITVDASVSSQFISALAMIGPYLQNGLEIILKGKIVSDSYLDMTLNLMKDFGISVIRETHSISILPGKYKVINQIVESDWSSASYFYALCGLLPDSEIEIFGLKENSLQGDSIIVQWFEKFGVKTEFTSSGVIIRSKKVNMPPIVEMNFINNPDLFQTFAFFLSIHGCQVLYSGLDTLQDKETDRIHAVKSELAKVGVHLMKLPSKMSKKTDGIHYLQEGKASFESLSIETYKDHRMAMAGSLLATLGDVEVLDPTVVTKSYPGFFDDLKSLGVKLT